MLDVIADDFAVNAQLWLKRGLQLICIFFLGTTAATSTGRLRAHTETLSYLRCAEQNQGECPDAV